MNWLELLKQSTAAATLLLLVAFVASWALRGGSAARRHFLWTAALAALVVLPAMVRVLPKWGIETAPLPAGMEKLAGVEEIATTQSIEVHATAPRREWNPALLAWLAGCAAFAVRLARGRRQVAGILRHATPAEYAREILRSAGGGGVPVVESPSAHTALAVGIFRPVVVLPAGAREWPVERLRAALLHEWMHIRRRDLAAQAVAQLAGCLYWFHPLVWLAARQLRREREQACDDAVLGRGISAQDYAAHLVESVRALRGRRLSAIAMAEPSLLEVRVRALLDTRRDRRPLNRAAALGIVAVLAMVLLPLTAVTVRAQSTPAPSPAPVAAAPLAPLAAVAPAIESAPQTATMGTLSGTVTDPSGARIPGCQVKATNQSGANEEVATADPAGNFTFASIPVGEYSLRVSALGFQTMAVRHTVTAGQPTIVNARLRLGEMSQAVTVSATRPAGTLAAAPQINPNRIRVGGMVQPAKILYKAPPVYPDDLKAKGISGVVHLAGVVTKQGFLQELRVLNTDVDPGLASAAMEAAAHWLYQPSMLNGEPVAVLTNIDVNFELVQ